MDRIAESLVFESIPRQILYLGEDHITLFGKKNKKFIRLKTFDQYQLMKLSDSDFLSLSESLQKVNTGVLLGSSFFIFNIIDFEKLPLRKKMCDEMVEWRLKKIFPDEINNYIHRYYKINRKRVMSVLIKNETFEQIRSFNINNLTLIGNSSIFIINQGFNKWIWSLSKTPDLVIEVDRSSYLIVAQSKGVPFYLRKFRLNDPLKIQGEVTRILTFIQSNFNREMKTYQLTYQTQMTDLEKLQQGLTACKLSGRAVPFEACLNRIK